MVDEGVCQCVAGALDADRLLQTARALVDVPSPTREAGAVSDKLSEILTVDGFDVERVDADWSEAPAVVVRLDGEAPGRTIQFDGHLDTVHLPFNPSAVENGVLKGSGASDMKGGVAAFVEAMRVLKSTGLLRKEAVMMTAHDHHEGPWGDKRQLKALIREGYVGDAVLFPEYLSNQLPLSGRGMGIFRATFSREGAPVREVLRPEGLADANAAGADFLIQLKRLNEELVARSSGVLRDSVFTGQIAGGEIYNQASVSCLVTGTRRWVRPGDGEVSASEVEALAQEAAWRHDTILDFTCSQQGDAFSFPEDAPIVQAFQSAYTVIVGQPLAIGEKPFLDDGNLFMALAGIPPITHGPDAKGAHTLDEAVAVDEMVRVARVLCTYSDLVWSCDLISSFFTSH